MLEEQVESAGRKVSTDSITMSFGEVSNYYRDKDLNINPEFQRAFRWSIQKKSNLIESMLLSIPLPSVFVFENEDKSWELVDGLQRLSTVFEFMGILSDPETGCLLSPSILVSTKYLPSLNGSVWRRESIDTPGGEEIFEISSSMQRKIRTTRLQVEILRHPSDAETKYDLFQRLNRGGETANAQEVRNCLCVMANEAAFKEMKSFANRDEFLRLLKLTENAIEQQRHLEWLMRILVHASFDYDGRKDVENFVDDSMRDILTSGSPLALLDEVDWVFNLLNQLFGDRALLPSLGGGGTGNRVSLRQIEAIAVGLVTNAPSIRRMEDPSEFVKSKVSNFWHQSEVDRMSAAGLSPTQRIPRTVPFGKDWFRP